MLSSKSGVWVIVLALTLSVALCGCGGSGESNTNQNVGNVSGHIADYTSQIGIGNVAVTIGGQTGLTDANGDFLVTGIRPGTYTVLVTPPAGTGLVLPSNSTYTVTVLAGDTTTLSSNIFLMDENDVPPDPPSG